MLSTKRQRGFTLIELMVGLAIMAFLLMSGAPSVSEWVRNSQIRSSAESILTGLQQARAEAVKRNGVVRFQLTSSLDSDCGVTATGRNWVINATSFTTPAGACANTPNDAVTPFMLAKNVAANATTPIGITASQPVIAFNGLGQQAAATNPTVNVAVATIDIAPSAAGTCLADKGQLRCLRIVVSPGGQARMCDPSLSGPTSVQPMAC